MGREAAADVVWQGQRGPAKALLESREIILRGGIKARIARASIGAVVVEGGTLVVSTGAGRLELALGADEAVKWQAALLKTPPTLAEKLGISAARPAFVIGNAGDPDLAAALAGAVTAEMAEATVLVAVLDSAASLDAAFAVAQRVPALAIWCVYPKGKGASITDSAIRTFLRGAGCIDTKTCAVSAGLTATRYARAKATG